MTYYPGQSIITSQGTVRKVAFVLSDSVLFPKPVVYVHAPNGFLERVIVRGEAWGGEHDAELVNG